MAPRDVRTESVRPLQHWWVPLLVPAALLVFTVIRAHYRATQLNPPWTWARGAIAIAIDIVFFLLPAFAAGSRYERQRHRR